MKGNPEPENVESIPSVIELDHVFTALAHPRRRYLLYTLREGTEWTLRELATRVTEWERDVPEEALTDDDIERTYVSLFHNHIPRLVEDEIITFRETDETISPATNAEQALAILEHAGGASDTEQEAHAREDE